MAVRIDGAHFERMKRRTILFGAVVLSVQPMFPLAAQCPDGSPPPCTRSAAPRVAVDPNAVAILPFRVSGPPEAQYLREGMLDLLNVALDGFAGWRVIQPRAFLRQVEAESGPIDVARAARLARQAGAATFVLGDVVALGPDLRVQAELYESARGTSLRSIRARGALAVPAPVADTIAGGLARGRLSSRAGGPPRALEEFTSTSPAALQAYLVAEQHARHARWQEASESLLVAIARDSTFALAYYAMYRAITWGSVVPTVTLAIDRSSGKYTYDDIIEGAIRHVDRAPLRQRRLLEFIFATNRADALRLADGLTRDYPDDADIWLERGDAYFHIGLQNGEPISQALEYLQRAIALDPTVPEAYLHVVQLQSMLGDSANAWQTMRRLQTLAPDWNATIGLALAMRAVWQREDPATLKAGSSEIANTIGRYSLIIADQEPARAVALADSFAVFAAAPVHTPAERATALLRRHVYQLARGRYAAAWDMLREASVLDPNGPTVLGATVVHQLVSGAHEAEAADAARQLSTFSGDLPLWASAVLAWRTAATTATDSAPNAARRLLAGGQFPVFRAAVADGLIGLISLRRGDSVAAHRDLARGNAAWVELRNIEEFFPGPALAIATARLDIRAGDLAAANRRLYETIGPIGIIFRGDAEELRGQIAEQRGDTATAIRGYRNFVALWKDADPELQPRVTAARAALARLER